MFWRCNASARWRWCGGKPIPGSGRYFSGCIWGCWRGRWRSRLSRAGGCWGLNRRENEHRCKILVLGLALFFALCALVGCNDKASGAADFPASDDPCYLYEAFVRDWLAALQSGEGCATMRSSFMKVLSICVLFGTLGFPPHSVNEAMAQEANQLTPVPIQSVTIEDSFWSPKRKVWQIGRASSCE